MAKARAKATTAHEPTPPLFVQDAEAPQPVASSKARCEARDFGDDDAEHDAALQIDRRRFADHEVCGSARLSRR